MTQNKDEERKCTRCGTLSDEDEVMRRKTRRTCTGFSRCSNLWTIALLMTRKPVAQGLINKLERPYIRLCYESDYTKADSLVHTSCANIALIEIAETGRYDAEFCLALCSRLHDKIRSCKLLIMCPEQDELSIAAAIDSKQEGIIEDFVFYDASIDYLASKLLIA